MNSRLALDVFACIVVVARPVLFIVKEDPSDHPIYKRTDRGPHEAECRD